MSMGEALGLGEAVKSSPIHNFAPLLLPSPAPSLPAQPITVTASSSLVPSKPALLCWGRGEEPPSRLWDYRGDSGSHLLPIGWKSLLKVEKCFLPAQHLPVFADLKP